MAIEIPGIDLRDRIKKVANQTDRELVQASVLSSVLNARDSLEDDLNSYVLLENLEKLSSDTPLFSNPSPEIARGDYALGLVENTDEKIVFGLRREERIRHALILGGTGAGKTNTVLVILRQELINGTPFAALDWKRNFRDMLNLPEAADKEILIFTVGRELCPFHFNPLIPPPGTSPTVWLGKVIEIMAHAFFLGEGVVYILSRALDHVYREFGVYEGKGTWPTFRNVLRFLDNYESKGRETQWLASALRAVSMLCFDELDRILNQANYPVEKLLETNVILELDALTDTAKIFLTEMWLLWVHHYRIGQGKRERFLHTTVIEEAHHILSRKLQMISGTETITDMIVREIRELGESLIIVDQNPSLLSVPTLGNTYATIAMNLKATSDVNLMAACLNLDYGDRDILTQLEVGQAVIKLQGRHTDPILIRIPKVEIAKGTVTDLEVKRRMAGFYKKLHETAPETTSSEETEENTIRNRKEEENRTKEIEKTNSTVELSREETDLLTEIYENQLRKVGEHYESLKLDPAKGNRIRSLLESKGLIQGVSLPNLEGRGYWGKALELTKNGRAALAQIGNFQLPDEASKRKGSLIHQHYIRLIADKLRQAGHGVSVEHLLGNGDAADILVDGQIAVELERSDRNTLQNVRKNLAKDFRVVLVAETPALKQRICKLLKQNDLQASVVGLRDFSGNDAPNLSTLYSLSPFSQTGWKDESTLGFTKKDRSWTG